MNTQFLAIDLPLTEKQKALHEKRVKNALTGNLIYMDEVTGSAIYRHPAGILNVFFDKRATKPGSSRDTQENLDKLKELIKKRITMHNARKESQAAEKAAAKNHNIKVGDIFTRTFSWEYTRAHYYQVVAVKGQTLSLRKVGNIEVEHENANHMSWYTIPAENAYLNDEIIKARVSATLNRGNEARFYVKLNGDYCYRNEKVNGEYRPDYNSQD